VRTVVPSLEGRCSAIEMADASACMSLRRRRAVE
jgi:hypothetical protein